MGSKCKVNSMMVTSNMCRVIGLIIALMIKAGTHAEEDLYNNNGWRPISKENILEPIHRNYINSPHQEYSTASWNPILSDEKNNVHLDQNHYIKPLDVNRAFSHKMKYFISDEQQDQMNVAAQWQDHNAEISESHNMNRFTASEQKRKAKKMMGNQENEVYNSISPVEETVTIQNNINLKEEGKEINNNYEVTEAIEATEIKDFTEVNKNEKQENKVYFKPNFETKTEKNLSNILFDILSNYNIRVNDDLTNYALSRTKPNSNSLKQGYLYSAPIKITPMRNSHNHFPLDPLLAVFLSNYGYYLPGFYGFPGNYYNIYGYLASNNIHNNKPFGAYKIYSDTDYSN